LHYSPIYVRQVALLEVSKAAGYLFEKLSFLNNSNPRLPLLQKVEAKEENEQARRELEKVYVKTY